MINLEQLQDLKALGISPIDKQPELKLEPWIEETFKKYGINCKNDQRVLNILINNLLTKYLAQQEKNEEIDKNKISLIREMSINELLYHYMYTWDLSKIISIQPLSNPAGLIYYSDCNETDITVYTDSVSARTTNCNKGVDMLFKKVQDDIMNELYKNLDPMATAEINFAELSYFLNSALCNNYNEVIYNKSITFDEKSNPMASNGIIIRTFDNLNKKKIEVNNGIAMDEVLLRNNKSQYDVGLAFCPYIIPMRTTRSDYIMARYGTWVSPDIAHYYKRIKVVK
ncbi:MAG: hypothetical protein GF364_09600 [Candidatus Lokiarchaeota archaeon]|nr:hypothetical protein [Candidatus Lokiarchaeota archaeon]